MATSIKCGHREKVLACANLIYEWCSWLNIGSDDMKVISQERVMHSLAIALFCGLNRPCGQTQR